MQETQRQMHPWEGPNWRTLAGNTSEIKPVCRAGDIPPLAQPDRVDGGISPALRSSQRGTSRRRYSRNPFASAAAILLITCLATLPNARAADETRLPDYETVGTRDTSGSPIVNRADLAASVYEVSADGLASGRAVGGFNPLAMLSQVPGVYYSGLDALGMANLQGGQKGLRIRGETSAHGYMGTVEGLALAGPGPGPGAQLLFDREDLAGVRVAEGAVAVDDGAVFNTAGSVDARLRWAEDDRHAELTGGGGSNSFQRLFARLDSGTLASGTALFLSGSTTQADKWRGNGEAPKGRSNLAAGLSQTFGDLDLRLFAVRSSMDGHNYRALTYDQATDLNQYQDYDYGTDPGVSSYYGYNRQDFRNRAVIGQISYHFNDQTRLTVKPFYADEKGYFLFAGSTDTMVQKWLLDHDTYGVNSTLSTRIAETRLSLGYSWTSADPPGPPTTRKMYMVSDDSLMFSRWSLLSKVSDRHQFQSAFVAAERELGTVRLEAGLRYWQEQLPGIVAYSVGTATAGSDWDISPSAAIARATEDPTRSVSSRTLSHWLPRLGARWQVTGDDALFVNLGRDVGAPALDAFMQTPAGNLTTSQDYWNQLRAETSNRIDLGAHLLHGSWRIDPTLYYSRSHDKSVAVFNADSNTVWSQNVGETEAWGALLGVNWNPVSALDVFGNLSWTRSEFVDDVQTASGTWLGVKGQQLPDVPKTIANLGLQWQHGNWHAAPQLQYLGERWGTTSRDEKLPDYTVINLDLGYETTLGSGRWSVSITGLNLFDRDYISQIQTSDVNTTANGAIYYPGAGRSVIAQLRVDLQASQ